MSAKVPDYRVAAFANLDLAEYMKDDPIVIVDPGEIEWDISETPYHYIAKGDIRIPVEVFFGKPEGDEDLEMRRVIVLGKRRFDARLDEIEDDEEPDYGIDEVQARRDSIQSYRKGMGMS